MNIGESGKNGETRVAAFLRKSGYKIVKRNYQCRYGEIDIIAEKNGFIVFVEVKTRKKNSMITPMEAVDSFKQQRIIHTAQDYIVKSDCTLQPRFDVAEVFTEPDNQGKTKYHLNYIKNAF